MMIWDYFPYKNYEMQGEEIPSQRSQARVTQDCT
jgi:hypothetical protein